MRSSTNSVKLALKLIIVGMLAGITVPLGSWALAQYVKDKLDAAMQDARAVRRNAAACLDANMTDRDVRRLAYYTYTGSKQHTWSNGYASDAIAYASRLVLKNCDGLSLYAGSQPRFHISSLQDSTSFWTSVIDQSRKLRDYKESQISSTTDSAAGPKIARWLWTLAQSPATSGIAGFATEADFDVPPEGWGASVRYARTQPDVNASYAINGLYSGKKGLEGSVWEWSSSWSSAGRTVRVIVRDVASRTCISLDELKAVPSSVVQPWLVPFSREWLPGLSKLQGYVLLSPDDAVAEKHSMHLAAYIPTNGTCVAFVELYRFTPTAAGAVSQSVSP